MKPVKQLELITKVKCASCDTVLSPDTANLETDYQFENALWIGFHGGYGMFVDNLDARMPTNTDERWLRNSDQRDQYGLYCDFKLGDVCECELQDATVLWEWHELKCPCRNPVDDPDYKPKYREERMLPGQPDYEAVICHDCAHSLCAAFPWLDKLIQPYRSHSHRQEYIDANPDHPGWDIDR